VCCWCVGLLLGVCQTGSGLDQLFDTLAVLSSVLSLPIILLGMVFFVIGAIILLSSYRRRRSPQTLYLSLFFLFAALGVLLLVTELGIGAFLGNIDTYPHRTGLDVVSGYLSTRNLDWPWLCAMLAVFFSAIAMSFQAAFALSFLQRKWMIVVIIPAVLALGHWIFHSWLSIFWWEREAGGLTFNMAREPPMEALIVALMVVPLLSGPVVLGYAAYGARKESKLAFRRAVLMTITQSILAVTYFFELFELPLQLAILMPFIRLGFLIYPLCMVLLIRMPSFLRRMLEGTPGPTSSV
jgi:hypothetical protein